MVTTEILNTIAARTGLSFDSIIDHVQANVLGFIQERDFFKLGVKASVPILGFPTPDQRFIPKLQASLMRVDLSVSFSGTAPILSVRTYSSNQTYDEKVLNGSQFTTNVSKSFDKQIKFGQKYNFVFDQDCTIEYMKVTEIPVKS